MALTNMCDATLAPVGRHHFLRSSEATPLHVGLGARVLVLYATCLILIVEATSHAGVIQAVLHVLT